MGRGDVKGKIRHLIESLLAKGARVGSLPRVGVNVILEISLLMETFAANGAFVRLVLLMRLHVGDEGGGSIKGLVADFAFKRSICRMNRLVAAQGRSLSETFSAGGADETPFSRMNGHMPHEGVLSQENLLTDVAAVDTFAVIAAFFFNRNSSLLQETFKF